MVDEPHHDGDEDDGVRSGNPSKAGTPRWVKIFGIVGLIVALAIVVLTLAGRGGHGPGRHIGDARVPLMPTTDHAVQRQ